MMKITGYCKCKVNLLQYLSSTKLICVGEVLFKTSAFVITSVGSLKLLTLSKHEIRIRFLAGFLAKENLLAPAEKAFPAI